MADQDQALSSVVPDSAFSGCCLCGAVRYTGLVSPVYQIICICTQCQTIGGGFGVGSLVIARESLRIDKGEDQLQDFAVPGSAAAVVRRFCKNCGTHIVAFNEAHPVAAVSAGTITDPTLFKPQVVIWCQSKRPHHVFPEGLPQFDQYPPR